MPVWTWSNHSGSSRINLFRSEDRDRIGCLHFKLFRYTNHKFVICKVHLDRTRRHVSSYSKLNVSLPARTDYMDRINELVNKRWWISLKTAIRLESVAFSKDLNLQRNRLEGELVDIFEEAISKGIMSGVLVVRMALCYFFEAKRNTKSTLSELRLMHYDMKKLKPSDGSERSRRNVETKLQSIPWWIRTHTCCSSLSRCVRLFG